VAGAGVVGDPAAFHGATPATTLKVAGVDLFAGRAIQATVEACDEILFADTRRRRYRKLVLDGDRLASATLVGDVAAGQRAVRPAAHRRSGSRVAARARPGRPIRPPMTPRRRSSAPATRSLAAKLLDAIRRGGLTTVAGLGRATRAGTGCGGCVRGSRGAARAVVLELRGRQAKPLDAGRGGMSAARPRVGDRDRRRRDRRPGPVVEAIRDRDREVPVTLLCGEPRLPYDRVRLSELLASGEDPDALTLRPRRVVRRPRRARADRAARRSPRARAPRARARGTARRSRSRASPSRPDPARCCRRSPASTSTASTPSGVPRTATRSAPRRRRPACAARS
jgi:bacterioferritin-associated ferredoxin